ncbi:hypothetical protein J6G99_01530 [bacterium]|nr:hypothetical protein [bacterium]
MNSKIKLALKILLSAIIGIAIFIALIGIALFLIPNTEPVSKIKDYGKCLEAVLHKDKIHHFPKSIPTGAKSYLYCYPADYEGQGELVILRLTTDKSYIQKELNSHTFLNAKTPVGTVQNIYNMPTETVGISNEDLTFYVLKNADNEYYYKTYFPYFTGIGVDKNMENIVYYYIDPSD